MATLEDMQAIVTVCAGILKGNPAPRAAYKQNILADMEQKRIIYKYIGT